MYYVVPKIVHGIYIRIVSSKTHYMLMIFYSSCLSVFKSEHHHLKLLTNPKQNFKKREAVQQIFSILYLNKQPGFQLRYFMLITK